MSHSSYTTEDFVLDKEFRDWVLEPDNESNKYWQEWMETNPDKVDIIKSAIALIQNLPVEQHQLSAEEVSQITKNIEAAIDQGEANGKESREDNIIPISPYSLTMKEIRQGKNKMYIKWMKVAAAIAMLTAISFVFYDNFRTDEPLTTFEVINKENPKGQKSTIYLNDGSKIILNANSSISYRKPFRKDKREITLEGEAFFEVAKDENRPFTVKSGNIATTALGTSFNIKAYPEGQQVKVSLATGKVRIDEVSNNANNNTHLLEPGQELTYSPISGYTKTPFDNDEVLAWVHGVIHFKNADAEAVITKLESWYGVDIDTANESTRTWNITARFDNESLENVLQSLSYSEKFEYTINEKNILIKY